jgi:hypothetical protein
MLFLQGHWGILAYPLISRLLSRCCPSARRYSSMPQGADVSILTSTPPPGGGAGRWLVFKDEVYVLTRFPWRGDGLVPALLSNYGNVRVRALIRDTFEV